MFKKLIYISFFLILAFISNANSQSVEITCDEVLINSPEILDGQNCKKKKITAKSAQIKFKDGSTYNGPIKKNRISGEGKLTLNDGTEYDCKFKGNKCILKISKTNRTYIKISFKKGISVQPQIKIKGYTKWYPAEINNGVYELSKKGELMLAQDKKKASGGGDGGGSGC